MTRNVSMKISRHKRISKAMAELTASILATAISAVVEKCKQIRAIPKIRDEALAVLINLTPIVDEIEPKLREKNHRQLIESLRAVLDEIENIVDYIICNPTKAKLWSSTYLKKLRNAIHAVDGWVGRAQAITLSISHDTQSKMDELQEMTAACEISIGAEITQVKEGLQHVVEHQGATLDEVQQVHKMLVEHCSIGKTDRFRQYLDDEDERLLQQVEAVAAKRAELPEHLICPLSKCLLEDPVMVTVSGNTYSKAMLNEHVSTRIRDGITVEDPISREEFDLKRDVVPNRAIADAIKNWKAKHFAYLKDVKEMKDLVVDSTPYGDSLETCSEHNVDHHEIRLCHKQASEDGRALLIKVKNTRVGNTYECEITEKEIVSGEIFEGHFPAVLASVDGFIEFFNDGLGVAANTEKGHSEIHCECNAHTDKYTIDIKTELGSGWKKISFGTHLEVPLQSEPTPIEKLSLEMERMRLEMMEKIQELNERHESKLIELSRENTELKSKTNDLERQNVEQKEALEEAKIVAKAFPDMLAHLSDSTGLPHLSSEKVSHLICTGNTELKAIMLTAMNMRLKMAHQRFNYEAGYYGVFLAFLKSGNQTQKAQVAEIISRNGNFSGPNHITHHKEFVGVLVTLISDGEEDGRLSIVRALLRLAYNDQLRYHMKSSIQLIENCYNKEEVPAVRTAMEDLLNKIKG